MGKQRRRARQSSMWVATADLPRSAGHPFYERLNRVLDEVGFDAFVEEQCARFYAAAPAGRVWRRAATSGCCCSATSKAWTRTGDCPASRRFAEPPTVPGRRAARRAAGSTSRRIWRSSPGCWLQRLADAGLVKGKTVGIDATTLEANAALRSLVRRDTGESYESFLRRLAEASGIATPTRAELAQLRPQASEERVP